ncbi:hypothetical protein HD553DRAFT_368436 [Filobasidium floriforme]|uniref:uncharacterized protein n=1 Tax=Filobasidium floriforme TaxID=5210 RepID=UPI001E8CAFC7|nr:uncharacterized protein HD553DRAFT_368436 [Filobasidium floriforme]KAH8087537.1 hypothetical protein HD553DRAFT_368436 [Filobasidium floriforme]
MSSLRDLVSKLSIGESGELLVLSFDIGTTQSGAALAYVAPEAKGSRAPAVLEKLPGQTPGKAKIPSVLMYDKKGVCHEKWGSQVYDLDRKEKAALKSGELVKSEWFKLYIDPERRINKKAFVSDKSKELPPGKTGFDLWGDFLGKLTVAAKQAAREEWAITWIPELEQRQKVKYIITIPVAWQKDPATMMALRKQALRVGLITEETSSCLSFCSESEASALHCRNDVFLVIDAGGGTVDFTSYKISKTEPLELEEIGADSKVCLYHGSTYVDGSFQEVLTAHLEQEYPLTKATEKHIEAAKRMFSTLRKPEFTFKKKVTGFWDISENEDDFDDGGIEVPWSLMEEAFKPHVDLIVETASAITQQDSPKFIFCSGGFGDSPYLRERLEAIKGVQIVQPEQTASSSGSKAVTLGACLYGLRSWVQKRITSKCIGCNTYHKIPSWHMPDPEESKNLVRRYGNNYVYNNFTPIIEHNQTVNRKDYYSSALQKEFPYPFDGPGKQCTFKVLESNATVTPKWCDDKGITELGSFEFFIPKDAPHEIEVTPDGTRLVNYNFEIRVYSGETELRAAIYSDGEILGKSAYLEGPADLIDD